MIPARKNALKSLVRAQETELLTLYNTGYAPEWEQFVLSLSARKLSGPSQRAQFVKFLYDYILEYSQTHGIVLPDKRLDEAKAIKLAVLAELVIDCQYYENYIFDGKNGVNTPDLIRKYINAAAHLKSIIFKYIRDNFKDRHGSEEIIRAEVDSILNIVNLGQQMESDYNSYYIFKSGLKTVPDFGLEAEQNIDYEALTTIKNQLLKGWHCTQSEHNFMITYLKRVSLANVTLFSKFAGLLVDLTGLPKEHQTPLKKFAAHFGFLSQLTNDNIDIFECATGTKRPEDAFSDLRNKNITLPLFFFLKQKDRLKKSVVLASLENDMPDGLIFEPKLVFESGRYFKIVRPVFKTRLKNELEPIVDQIATSILDRLSKLGCTYVDQNLTAGANLIDMTKVSYKNRFYPEASYQKEYVNNNLTVVNSSTETFLEAIWGLISRVKIPRIDFKHVLSKNPSDYLCLRTGHTII